MTQTATATGRWCAQHRRPLAECETWDRHNHSVRFREDVWADTERTAKAAKTEVVPFINEAVEARLGYIRCRRGSCMTDGPPVPVEFGDLTGKTLDEWLTAAVKQAESQHPRHEPVRIGARPSARPGRGKDAATREEPPAARTEPPAPVPAQRREAGRNGKTEPPVVAADSGLAATLASLQARIGQMEDRERRMMSVSDTPARQRAGVTVVPDVNPGSPVFQEPGEEPHVPYEAPEVPDRSRKRGRAKCSHHVPAGTRCKICEPRS